MLRHRFLHKNYKYKLFFKKIEIKKLILKFLFLSSSDVSLRSFYAFKLNTLSRISSSSRIRNFCLVSGQSRSVYRRFGLSRHILKDFLGQGFIKSFRKTGW